MMAFEYFCAKLPRLLPVTFGNAHMGLPDARRPARAPGKARGGIRGNSEAGGGGGGEATQRVIRVHGRRRRRVEQGLRAEAHVVDACGLVLVDLRLLERG